MILTDHDRQYQHSLQVMGKTIAYRNAVEALGAAIANGEPCGQLWQDIARLRPAIVAMHGHSDLKLPTENH